MGTWIYYPCIYIRGIWVKMDGKSDLTKIVVNYFFFLATMYGYGSKLTTWMDLQNGWWHQIFPLVVCHSHGNPMNITMFTTVGGRIIRGLVDIPKPVPPSFNVIGVKSMAMNGRKNSNPWGQTWRHKTWTLKFRGPGGTYNSRRGLINLSIYCR